MPSGQHPNKTKYMYANLTIFLCVWKIGGVEI